jgi:hypothetical protein
MTTSTTKNVTPAFIHVVSDLRINKPDDVSVVNLTSSIIQGKRHYWVNFHLTNGTMVSVMCFTEMDAKALFKDYNDYVDFIAVGHCDCDGCTDGDDLINKRPPAFKNSTMIKAYKNLKDKE